MVSRSSAASCFYIFATLAMVECVSDMPNIVFIMLDDLGWGNVGYHNPGNLQINTPNIDALVSEGLELNRFYAHWSCTPSRSSFQTGRLPIHVEESYDNVDSISEPDHGIPAEMTTIASKLKEANYSTFLVGKWYKPIYLCKFDFFY